MKTPAHLISLRDEIAMRTLPNMSIQARGIERLGKGNDAAYITLLADIAYRVADAMIKRRDK